ncbi:RtcB family protein [Halorubellus sp. JP-L1]|uniref:RtcB family protein n=1 Tax=Halorubellus sp. JP-L1 TaxID=2715753 RepID=UPI00140DC19D|nr:RtcB family protein [Halorubellus sp. JP-L1]NHN43063.1 RtcB family protein [Halorubellus sp. JP-L1]
MPIPIEGEHTTARVLVDDESLLEANCREQIQELVDHPAFTEPVRVMPDTHWGAGAPVGFTMPLGERIVPNVVGVDVGCGMAAANLGNDLPLADAERERRVRDAVPMGRDVREYDDAVHLVDDFPFDRANDVFESFDAAYAERFGERVDPLEFEFDGYDADYFDALCDRVLAPKAQGMGYVIRGVGTLGGGNHFVEFAQGRESAEYWLVVHSGSRYLGLAVAEYWQAKATDRRNHASIRTAIPDDLAPYVKFDPQTVSDEDLYEWVTGGKGESHIRKGKVRAEFDGKAIEETFDRLATLRPGIDDEDDESAGGDAPAAGRNEDLDYLEGREAHGYFVDMLFAQQYARWNREVMVDAICDALGVDPVERFQSVHNYVDFRDLTIRKGATPARDDQRLVVPFNMADGSVIASGKGNDEYHQTAPHGAGRVMGRGDAFDRLSMAEFEAAMDGVYSESVVEGVVDEAPMAYKDADRILGALEPTAEVEERLDVVHNLKAKE